MITTVLVSKRSLILFTLLIAATLLVCYVLLSFFGFKIVAEAQPKLSSSVELRTTDIPKTDTELVFTDRLFKLQLMLDTTKQDIEQLQILKRRFINIATPAVVRNEYKDIENSDPNARLSSNPPVPVRKSFEEITGDFERFQKELEISRQDWIRQLSWLEKLPTGVPISGEFLVSKGFGMLKDPSTGKLSRHEGIDFDASLGTPILSAADGVVSRVVFDRILGNTVEISHAEGFITRYGHAKEIHVKKDQQVKRGEHIADVGRSGKATHSHLHYEVLRHSSVLNPLQVLPMGDS